MKKCPDCQKTKPLSDFGVRLGGIPQSKCRPCQRAYGRKHYADNKPAYNARRRITSAAMRRRNRAIIRAAKDCPCADCDRRYPYYVMQFDHLRDKVFTIGNAVNYLSKEKLLAEIAKCDVVCANCHMIRSHRRRNPV